MTTVEAAEMLGVSKQTVQKWVDAGHLPAWRTVGGHRRLDRDAVERMLLERQRASAGPSASSVLSVLIVEDNPLDLQLAIACISEAFPSAQIHSCSDGVSGLVEVGRAPPDLLLVDAVLPELDGPAMVARLRANPRTQNLRVVLLSGMTPQDLANHYGTLPPDLPLLSKPLTADALRQLFGPVAQALLAAPR